MKQLVYIIIGLVFYSTFGQQEAQYSQYMYNMNVVNPAYVTNNPGVVYLGSLYRRQWTGLEGAPNTANVFANIPLSEKTELSVNYLNDRIGENVVLNDHLFTVDYAYILKLSPKTRLSLGIKAGVNNLSLDATNSNVSGDPNIQNNSTTALTLGAGAYIFTDNFYAGISSPNFPSYSLEVDEESQYTNKTQLYITAGYVYPLNSNVKLKPSTVVKQAFGAPMSFDVSLNALFYEKFEVGSSYRYQDAIAIMAAVNITYNFRIGYAYDYNISKLGDFNNGSHEVILLYNLDFVKTRKYTSPRFF